MSYSRFADANDDPGTPRNVRRAMSGVLRAVVVASLLAIGGFASAADPAFLPANAPANAPRTVAVGDALPALPLRDQHGAEVRIDAATRIVLFTRDMDGGGFVKEALADSGSAMLKAAQAVYVSDVSRMPGFILSTFALPSIRRRDYPVVLDEDGTVTASLPYNEGKATILTLDAGRITAVSFASSAADVAAALGK